MQQLRQGGKAVQAVELGAQLVRIEPDNAHVQFAYAGALHDAGRLTEAAAGYRASIKLDPGNAASRAQLARCLADLCELPEAVATCRDALKKAPGSLGLHQLAGKVYTRMARFKAAAGHYRAVADASGHFGDYLELGQTLYLANDISASRRSFEKAISAGAPKAPAMVMLARLAASRGDFDAAHDQLLKALEVDPDYGLTHLQLADDLGDRIDTERHISLALRALETTQGAADPHSGPIPLHFALAKLHERCKAYDDAFRHYETGNRLTAALQADDSATVADQVEANRQRYTRDVVDELAIEGSTSTKPVFVFGLPRSGTTLVEQILAAHPKAAGLGEIEALDWMPRYLHGGDKNRFRTAAQAYLASAVEMAPDAEKTIDKSINTYLHAGMAMCMFPEAKLISCRRQPMDVAHSMYTMYFGPVSVPFANSFERLVQRMHLHERMLEHWHCTFPGRILDVRYEDLVANPEECAKQIVAHAGLHWDPACLEYHTRDSIVHTASLAQVRQPIYSSAIDKWKRYEIQLGPLASQLADLTAKYARIGG